MLRSWNDIGRKNCRASDLRPHQLPEIQDFRVCIRVNSLKDGETGPQGVYNFITSLRCLKGAFEHSIEIDIAGKSSIKDSFGLCS